MEDAVEPVAAVSVLVKHLGFEEFSSISKKATAMIVVAWRKRQKCSRFVLEAI